MNSPQHIAIVGAGMAAITCARTLVQAGYRVSVLEKSKGVGGRMSTRTSPFGSFDHGAQYFTVRDARFKAALQTTPQCCKPWSATTVQVLDSHGQKLAANTQKREPHWVPTPGMNGLLQAWAEPLLQTTQIMLATQVTAIEADALHPHQWQLRTSGTDGSSGVLGGFDGVVLAIPGPQAQMLLETLPKAQALKKKIAHSTVAPCWTLMLAFPQAVQPGLTTLGPQWNAARSNHHRIAWLARESSKPARNQIERWTVQASAAWSQEHLQDDPERVCAKLSRAFTEITGIRAQPVHAQVHRWLYAQTEQALGVTHLWDAKNNIGICGDWCLGRRVEDAFVSGLELALHINNNMPAQRV